MIEMLSSFGYLLSGAGFAVLALLLISVWRARSYSIALTMAILVSSLSCFSFAVLVRPDAGFSLSIFFLEVGRNIAWLIFLAILFGGAVGQYRLWLVRYGGLFFAISVAFIGLWQWSYVDSALLPEKMQLLLAIGTVFISLAALVQIEQVFRNARGARQKGLKFLCVATGCMFAYELALYSNAVASGQISLLLWDVRGYVFLMCAALIALASARGMASTPGIFMSRKVVFYATTLLGAGAYLAIVGVSGYYIRSLESDSGPLVQLVFFVAAAVVFLILVLSERLRARIKVLITKHFFRDRYDYREEWSRLIETLTTQDDVLPIKKRAIKSLAQILDTESGSLWMRSDESGNYQYSVSWNQAGIAAEAELPDALTVFLARTGWVIDLQEYVAEPQQYPNLELSTAELDLLGAGFVIPLMHNSELLGLVILSPPRLPIILNFEDRDLLKTAGKQIASYLAQEIATEQLAASRQFETFNKLTAFIMHDLKNAIAQQSLVVENAEKHRRNPKFVDDAIDTISASVTRMKKVVDFLQQRDYGQPVKRLDLTATVKQAASDCSDRRPRPTSRLTQDSVWIVGNGDRILAALQHAIGNAQDAAGPNGEVGVSIQKRGDECEVCIKDNGEGMDDQFISERLFRPFDSTKGAGGMGIGAYQVRETVRAVGGEVLVSSEKGLGTRFRLIFPTVS